MKRLVKLKTHILILAAMIFVSGCTDYISQGDIDALNRIQPVGSAFTRQLTEEYRKMANQESEQHFDFSDAVYFARKGLDAARGNIVNPEPLQAWDLMPVHIRELGTARGRLVNALDMGAREIAPVEAAVAQARFDCWIEQQEENWQFDDILSCKRSFLNAMARLETAIAPPPYTPPVPAPPVENQETQYMAGAPLRPEDAKYLVFFGFNESNVDVNAAEILDAVAMEVKRQRLNAVHVVGHTDRAGSERYNEKLALKRAIAVRKALIDRGIPASLVRIQGRGEKEQLVRTRDGVREPANRRAEISFE